MVFCGLFPIDGDEFALLRESLEAAVGTTAVHVRAGDIGSARLRFPLRVPRAAAIDIVRERLEREFGLSLIATAPSVEYRVHNSTATSSRSRTRRRCLRRRIDFVEEPYLKVTILTPSTYTVTLMELCQQRRGEIRRWTTSHPSASSSCTASRSPRRARLLRPAQEPHAGVRQPRLRPRRLRPLGARESTCS